MVLPDCKSLCKCVLFDCSPVLSYKKYCLKQLEMDVSHLRPEVMYLCNHAVTKGSESLLGCGNSCFDKDRDPSGGGSKGKVLTGQEEMASNCSRRGLVWIPGTISAQKGLYSTGTDSSGKWWNHHTWKC